MLPVLPDPQRTKAKRAAGGQVLQHVAATATDQRWPRRAGALPLGRHWLGARLPDELLGRGGYATVATETPWDPQRGRHCKQTNRFRLEVKVTEMFAVTFSEK